MYQKVGLGWYLIRTVRLFSLAVRIPFI